jgi:uncharacterized protein
MTSLRPTNGTRLTSAELAAAESKLDAWFGDCPSAAVAFSGGVDSGLVAYWARNTLGRDRCTAWTGDSPSLKRADLDGAREFCQAHDIVLRTLETREIDNPDYAANPSNRCFHCKTTLYRALIDALAGTGVDAWICSGANLDDQGDYRPGLVAASNASVRHPLLECGIDKRTIRALARRHGLSLWDKPASPCLSSRVPYGQPVTREKLRQIEAAEGWLAGRGFPVCRVRHHGDTGRIEVPVDRLEELRPLWEELAQRFRSFGFHRVELDEEGLVSGKLNRALRNDRTVGRT